jgi:hypothetical protein
VEESPHAAIPEPPAVQDGFASLPRRITDLLASGGFQNVVLILIDAFGWRFFEKYQ